MDPIFVSVNGGVRVWRCRGLRCGNGFRGISVGNCRAFRKPPSGRAPEHHERSGVLSDKLLNALANSAPDAGSRPPPQSQTIGALHPYPGHGIPWLPWGSLGSTCPSSAFKQI